MVAEGVAARPGAHTLLANTLICFVLVDPQSRHAFCSLYDVEPGPILGDGDSLTPEAMGAIGRSRALFINGFIFDELSPGLIERVAVSAKEMGTVLMFDPGPRCLSIMAGARPGREAMQRLIGISDVVLATREEAAAISGRDDPHGCAEWVLQKSGSETKWCLVKMGEKGAILHARHAPGPLLVRGVQVEVSDTVGCGDSFAAGVALGYIEGWDLEGALELANAVGAATAMGRGAGRNVASTSDVLHILTDGRTGEARRSVESALSLLRSSLEGSSLGVPTVG
ncbi:unnamed protein product [Ostreobium quekettii]|uniref:Carbohydrate kinase PfkB domain-containing protein n=1 Tax=Ostreobium quekettii TaxID=121088 RepID=A0A8S1JEA7_9CHLO|nr:unnamed protein product [Ostreobium quekettii]|eukprot:evm.model.scf_328.4 EVM.evm.TU.scf_328.4   scf_328:49085-49933(+)